MSNLETAGDLSPYVELAKVKFICTAKLQANKLVMLPVLNDSIYGNGYLLSFESATELAVNILSEVLRTENAEAIKPIMARIKSQALKTTFNELSD